MITKTSAIILNTKMPSLIRPLARQKLLFIPILVISFFFVFSQVSGYTEQKTDKLRIGVPRRATFKNFVEIKQSSENPNKKNYTGFCIELFKEIHEKLDDQIPYEFEEFDGSYDDLVANVANKTFGAEVGDITILADRWKEVDFSEPFTESGLSMIVPVKPSPKAWIFLYPFTLDMWLAIGVVLVYTMFVVWFVEHRSNPEFSGPWNDQLGSALWFTFCSLFLAHREKIQSNYARIVVVVWLFLGLVLTQSYTANLTSMLTISRLQPTIQSPSKHSKIGCDGNTFMEKYVKNVLNYKNVTLISDEDEYSRELENGTILAAFLEIPYAKVFLNKYCKKFSIIGTTYRFGGFGFIFHKGCRITRKVSKAILQLSENGTLKELEQKWLTPNNNECSKSQTTAENIDSLSFQNFWGLFVFSGTTSSVCFLLFLVHLLRNYRHHQSSRVADHNSSDESVSVKTFRVVRYLINAPKTMETSPNQALPETEMR